MKNIEIARNTYKIGLLSKSQFNMYKSLIPNIGMKWWLQTPGDMPGYVTTVSEYGSVANYGCAANMKINGVRPVIVFAENNLQIGEKFSALGNRWIVLATADNVVAISENIIGLRPFDENSNLWEFSELRKWLESWAEEAAA